MYEECAAEWDQITQALEGQDVLKVVLERLSSRGDDFSLTIARSG